MHLRATLCPSTSISPFEAMHPGIIAVAFPTKKSVEISTLKLIHDKNKNFVFHFLQEGDNVLVANCTLPEFYTVICIRHTDMTAKSKSVNNVFRHLDNLQWANETTGTSIEPQLSDNQSDPKTDHFTPANIFDSKIKTKLQHHKKKNIHVQSLKVGDHVFVRLNKSEMPLQDIYKITRINKTDVTAQSSSGHIVRRHLNHFQLANETNGTSLEPQHYDTDYNQVHDDYTTIKSTTTILRAIPSTTKRR